MIWWNLSQLSFGNVLFYSLLSHVLVMQLVYIISCYFLCPSSLMYMEYSHYTTWACISVCCMIDCFSTQLYCLLYWHIVSVKCVKNSIGVCHSWTNTEDISFYSASFSVNIVEMSSILINSWQHQTHWKTISLVVVNEINHHARCSCDWWLLAMFEFKMSHLLR